MEINGKKVKECEIEFECRLRDEVMIDINNSPKGGEKYGNNGTN